MSGSAQGELNESIPATTANTGRAGDIGAYRCTCRWVLTTIETAVATLNDAIPSATQQGSIRLRPAGPSAWTGCRAPAAGARA